jgi:hypothetical protein
MKSILMAATALAILCGPALAERPNSDAGSNGTGNATSSSNSSAKATSSTRSASKAAAIGNSTTVNVSGYTGTEGSGTGGSGSTGTGTTGGYLEYGGGYTVRNTPEVIAPSIVGGNPCSVGASGGMSLPGFGLALGATWADKACERRQIAALMFNMGEKTVAFEVMCQDDVTRAAMKTAGKPCVADIAAVAQAMAPAMQIAALAAPAVAPTMAQAPAVPKPEWCAKAAPTTAASEAYVLQVCGR